MSGFKSNPSTPVVLWLRNDLRLHDHAGWHLAQRLKRPVCAVFVLPAHWSQTDAHGMHRLGAAKLTFLHRTLAGLRNELAHFNLPLTLLCGDPVELFTSMANQQAFTLLTSEAQAPEEQAWLQQLQQRHLTIDTYCAQPLFNYADIARLLTPFPGSFSAFRRKVEAKHGPAIPAPTPPVTQLIPASFDWQTEEYNLPSGTEAEGEQAALDWVNTYLFQRRAISHYKQTRNRLHGSDYASHMSAFLAWGSLSARTLWHNILAYEAAYGSNEQSYWLRFELLWREFFHWSLRKHGAQFFHYGGLCEQGLPPAQFDPVRWQAWCQAKTGVPMVDAGLLELRYTGYVSNRLRQNLASYFIHQLKLDWRLGARWFEQHLTDFDVASNYGNWAYIAGAGHDPRHGREFSLNKQLRQYDPHCQHIRHWLPALKDVSLGEIERHQQGTAQLAGYPPPVVVCP
ncbi:DASH family cryptochrome [Bowmanella sp. JS7-9]|uniref:Cryptochrome DASH n=1 Tax=Pseudobowmanella zhangzhouensis TaxID=1537679 RepID=A0ABW1XN23_9ALTE|nr:DASH family cryptochrome [Bowmanella sp. JS7-9]